MTVADLPLKVALVFDVPTAESGQCVEVQFAPGDCKVSPNGKRITCH